jgi:hypothetical protein
VHLLSSLTVITDTNVSTTGGNANPILEATDSTSIADIINIDPSLPPLDDLHAFDFSSLTAPQPMEDLQAMGGTEFWLRSETSLALDNTPVATTLSSPDPKSTPGIRADETTTLINHPVYSISRLGILQTCSF